MSCYEFAAKWLEAKHQLLKVFASVWIMLCVNCFLLGYLNDV